MYYTYFHCSPYTVAASRGTQNTHAPTIRIRPALGNPVASWIKLAAESRFIKQKPELNFTDTATVPDDVSKLPINLNCSTNYFFSIKVLKVPGVFTFDRILMNGKICIVDSLVLGKLQHHPRLRSPAR